MPTAYKDKQFFVPNTLYPPYYKYIGLRGSVKSGKCDFFIA